MFEDPLLLHHSIPPPFSPCLPELQISVLLLLRLRLVMMQLLLVMMQLLLVTMVMLQLLLLLLLLQMLLLAVY